MMRISFLSFMWAPFLFIIQARHSVIIGTLDLNCLCLYHWIYLWDWLISRGKFVFKTCRTRIWVECIVALIWTKLGGQTLCPPYRKHLEQKVSPLNYFHLIFFSSGNGWFPPSTALCMCSSPLFSAQFHFLSGIEYSVTSFFKPPSTSYFLHPFLVTHHCGNFFLINLSLAVTVL